MASKQYFVYIMASSSHSTYTGVTRDIETRVWQRKNGTYKGHTSKYNIDRLVWYASFEGPGEAIYREKEIKGWRRNKKLKLIEENNPEWLDLAADW